MTYLYEVLYSIDNISSLGLVLELMLITSCLATIVYLATKNQYISYLSAGPLYYFMSQYFYHSSHLILVIIAMSVQALVILFIQKKDLLSKISSKDNVQKV